MNIEDVMTDKVYVVRPDDNIAHIKREFVRHDVGRVAVVNQAGKFMGMVTEKDLLDVYYRAKKPMDHIFAANVMQSTIPQVGADVTPEQAAKALVDSKKDCVVVFESEFLGIATKEDLVRYFAHNYHGKAQVSDLMTKGVISIGPYNTIYQAMKRMEENNIQRLAVVDGKRYVGIITQKDVVLSHYAERPVVLNFSTLKRGRQEKKIRFMPMVVSELMKTDVETVRPNSDAAKAAGHMLSKVIGGLFVVDDFGIPIGVISKTDIVNYLAKQ